MGEPVRCDCLNRCGDDERVEQYLVEPCGYRMQCARSKKAELEAEVALRLDAARWRWFREARLPNGLGVVGDELDAAVDEEIRWVQEVSRG